MAQHDAWKKDTITEQLQIQYIKFHTIKKDEITS